MMKRDVNPYHYAFDIYLGHLVHPSIMDSASPSARQNLASEITVDWQFLRNLLEVFVYIPVYGRWL
jgi:hypothetical protein